MDIRKKYSEICSYIPEIGVSLEQLKETITLCTNYHREETLVHHVKMMERLGFVIRKDLRWYSKYQYPKKDEIKPMKEIIIEDDVEKEADDFLDKFKGGKNE